MANRYFGSREFDIFIKKLKFVSAVGESGKSKEMTQIKPKSEFDTSKDKILGMFNDLKQLKDRDFRMKLREIEKEIKDMPIKEGNEKHLHKQKLLFQKLEYVKNEERGFSTDLILSEPETGKTLIGSIPENLDQQLQQNDEDIDKDLDNIHEGVKKIAVIAGDMKEELDKQDEIIEIMDNKVDKLDNEYHYLNKRTRELLNKVGNSKECCCYGFIIILILGIAAACIYILNIG